MKQSKTEIQWIYTARALCVVAVVAYHVYIWHFVDLRLDPGSLGGSVWEQISRLLGALRMPLLLMVSGILAAHKIRGISDKSPWRWAATNYYLYISWLLIYAALGVLLASTSHPNFVVNTSDLALQMVSPDSSLWYIFALALYAAILIPLRPVPAWFIITILAALNLILAAFGPEIETMLHKSLRLFVFFAVGVYGRELFLAAGKKMPWAVATAGTLAGLVAFGLSTLPMHELAFEALYLVRSLTFGGAMVGISALIVRARAIQKASLWVGSRTLGIYVIHPPLIIAANAALQETALAHTVSSNDLFGLIYPIVFTGCCVALAVGIEVGLKRLGLRFLFQMPNVRFSRRSLDRR